MLAPQIRYFCTLSLFSIVRLITCRGQGHGAFVRDPSRTPGLVCLNLPVFYREHGVKFIFDLLDASEDDL